MANSDAQNESIYNGKDDAVGTGAGTNNLIYLTAAGDIEGTAAIQSVTSGTAFQVSAKRAADVYINITTAAALKIEMGPTSAAATQVSPSQSSALGVVSLRVPAGWYVKLTGTNTNYVVTTILR